MGAEDGFRAWGAMSIKPNELGLETAKRYEWLLANGLGGYSSSTVVGLNTRKYHGLMVSSRGNLDRRVAVESLIEELVVGGDSYYLTPTEYSDGLDERSVGYLRKFTRAMEHVRFEYNVNGTDVVKIVHAVKGMNAAVVSYGVRSNVSGTSVLRVRPLVNSRSIHEINPPGREFRSALYDGRILGASCGKDNIMFSSDDMLPRVEGVWYKNVRYFLEAERGEAALEDVFSPGTLELKVGSFSKAEGEIYVVAAENGVEPAAVFSSIEESPYRPFEPDQMQVLEAAADSFVAYMPGTVTIVAGYHWFADWGRDSMISLPGLTLVNGRYHDAAAILARFIDNMKDGRIPTKFEPSGPIYNDFDGTLWMVDRLKEFVEYVGPEAGTEFLRPRWGKVKSVVLNFGKLVEGGVLRNKSGTWMDTLERNGAVEIQALWYNALNVVEELSELMEDPLDLTTYKSDVESAFLSKYWTGSHLRDCLDDDSIRPNQVIAASLDYSPVPEKHARELMKVVEAELLTPCGLRTLDRKDPDYHPQYVGGVEERKKAYHNGTVWPWLVGPYVKTATKLGGDKGRKYALEVLRPMLNLLFSGCIGTIAEVYDAEKPHTPRGAVSQAWNVAEVLRAYHEDAKAAD